jgi:hypothetical protein
MPAVILFSARLRSSLEAPRSSEAEPLGLLYSTNVSLARASDPHSVVLLVEREMTDLLARRLVYVALDHRIVKSEGNMFNTNAKFLGSHASYIR